MKFIGAENLKMPRRQDDTNMEIDFRDRVVLTETQVLNAYGTDFPDDEEFWNTKKYCKKFGIKIVSIDGNELSFDLMNVDLPFANAIRRVLLAEVPTMAIEKVLIDQNTSIIQDEVLAHRLGLIPVRADPRLFEYRTADDLEPRQNDTIVFKMRVKCTKKPRPEADAALPEQIYDNTNVYSRDLCWHPIGDQQSRFKNDPIRCVDGDILIAKLRCGNEIDLTCHCYKGIGRDHAKFSPVATASYRLMPEIRLLRSVEGEQADRLKACFSDGVIDVLQDAKSGKRVAKVVDARKDTCSRNVLRHEDLADAVLLTRNKKHVIFSVESTGILSPEELVGEAFQVLQTKCRKILNALIDS